MPVHSAIGTRMKDYESRNQYYLQKRTPVIIRVDGRAFHTFTKNLKRPYDNVFQNSMIKTMEAMAAEIQNCVFAYCQSDEITFVLNDYQQLNTSAWFDYRTDKICSVAASLATYYFNRYFKEEAQRIIKTMQDEDYNLVLLKCIESQTLFDARCFNIPKEEVTNCIYWRQLDAIRNSILMLGQSMFSHKQLMNKTCEEVKKMCEEAGTSWDKLPIYKQRGTCCCRENGMWVTDYTMPILLKEERDYLEKLI